MTDPEVGRITFKGVMGREFDFPKIAKRTH